MENIITKLLVTANFNINRIQENIYANSEKLDSTLKTSFFNRIDKFDNAVWPVIPSKLPDNFAEWEHAFPTAKAIITKHLNYNQQKMLGQYIREQLPHMIH